MDVTYMYYCKAGRVFYRIEPGDPLTAVSCPECGAVMELHMVHGPERNQWNLDGHNNEYNNNGQDGGEEGGIQTADARL